MENFILIAIGILVVLLILRFIFKIAKTFINIAAAIVLLGIALHFFSPQTLDKIIGVERHERWTEEVKVNADTVLNQAGEKTQELLDKVDK